MAYCGYITKIKDISKHPNADKLQIVKLFNTQSIVDLTYTKGQKVVYFPEGGNLNEEYAKKCNLIRIKNEEKANSIIKKANIPEQYVGHFKRQRKFYYSTEALERITRDACRNEKHEDQKIKHITVSFPYYMLI